MEVATAAEAWVLREQLNDKNNKPMKLEDETDEEEQQPMRKNIEFCQSPITGKDRTGSMHSRDGGENYARHHGGRRAPQASLVKIRTRGSDVQLHVVDDGMRGASFRGAPQVHGIL